MDWDSKVVPMCTMFTWTHQAFVGVLYHQKIGRQQHPLEKQYIHEVQSRDGVNMVVTMLPSLADRVHAADASLHDNTYKRLFGEWKEWEVVIWDKRLNTSAWL